MTLYIMALIMALAGFSNCRPRATENTLQATTAELMHLIVATNRMPSGDRNIFGPDLAPSLSYGFFAIEVPPAHIPGMPDLPSAPRIGTSAHNSFFALRSATPADNITFQNALVRETRYPISRGAIYIHGFNVDFEEALFNATQFFTDTKYVGTPMLFSWPARGWSDPITYRRDERVNRLSETPLTMFLDGMMKIGFPKLDIICHSMGCRLLLESLNHIAKREQRYGNQLVQSFDNIIVASADIGFERFKEIYPNIRGMARQIAVYTSTDDDILNLSRIFNNEQRLGAGDSRLGTIPGLVTVDSTEVATFGTNRHWRFSRSPAVLSDLARTLEGELYIGREGLIQIANGIFRIFPQP